jgi:hypothetical protein
MQVKYKESQAIYAMKVRDQEIGGREREREGGVPYDVSFFMGMIFRWRGGSSRSSYVICLTFLPSGTSQGRSHQTQAGGKDQNGKDHYGDGMCTFSKKRKEERKSFWGFMSCFVFAANKRTNERTNPLFRSFSIVSS